MTDVQWADEPIVTPDQDRLGRDAYARQVAALIQSAYRPDASAVFGLIGPWGSGKTSLINLIVAHLSSIGNEWSVANFTPWATTDVQGLLAEFYSALSSVLPAQNAAKIRKSLAKLVMISAPAANLIPYGGSVVAEAAKSGAQALEKSQPWQTAFAKASERLHDSATRILVIVDDIDRLDAIELPILLKVVRLLGRFPGVQYLLAYDIETLARNLTGPGGADSAYAERYMEKIVQYPLAVPPLLKYQQVQLLNAGLREAMRGRTEDAGNRRLSTLLDSFTTLLRTPRSIDRYVAQLRHHLPLLPMDEIDDDDVQILTLIRVCFPVMFDALPRHRDQLLKGHTDDFKPGARTLEYEPFDSDPLLGLVPQPELREVARRLLITLFPNLPRSTGYEFVTPSVSGRGVSVGEYFDRYFAMGIPDHDVSDATIAEVARSAWSGDDELLARFVVGADRERQTLVITKVGADGNQPPDDDRRQSFACALYQLANQVDDDDAWFSVQDMILSLAAKQLASMDALTEGAVIIDVLNVLTHNGLRIRAMRFVGYELERRYRPQSPQWVELAVARIRADAVEHVCESLVEADAAPTDVATGTQLHFVLDDPPSVDELRDFVARSIGNGQVALDTLASRFVSARSIMGTDPDWTLSPDVDQQNFDRIAPPADDPWYQREPVEVDPRDLSWQNKRRFAAGRFHRPNIEA